MLACGRVGPNLVNYRDVTISLTDSRIVPDTPWEGVVGVDKTVETGERRGTGWGPFRRDTTLSPTETIGVWKRDGTDRGGIFREKRWVRTEEGVRDGRKGVVARMYRIFPQVCAHVCSVPSHPSQGCLLTDRQRKNPDS